MTKSKLCYFQAGVQEITLLWVPGSLSGLHILGDQRVFGDTGVFRVLRHQGSVRGDAAVSLVAAVVRLQAVNFGTMSFDRVRSN